MNGMYVKIEDKQWIKLVFMTRMYRDARSTKHKIVQYILTLISNLLHNIHHLFTAPTCFGHTTGPSSLSYKLLRRIQYVLQVDTRNGKNVHIVSIYNYKIC
jgi:hypothetical protein